MTLNHVEPQVWSKADNLWNRENSECILELQSYPILACKTLKRQINAPWARVHDQCNSRLLQLEAIITEERAPLNP